MRTCVKFAGVEHDYGNLNTQQQKVLSNINFEIEKHEFVAVLGPSGCGKSTLIKLLSGLETPTSGSVQIFGKPASEVARDNVGIVFQKPTLLPWKSIIKNVVFPIKHRYGRVRDAETQRAFELLDMAGLTEVARHFPHQLSGGMQQRVGIVRALLMDPDILVMDEPFSALDALTREKMGFEMLDMWREKPKTVLFITHSIAEAVLLADRILVMSPAPGTIQQQLKVELPKPRSLHTLNNPQFSALTHKIRQLFYSGLEDKKKNLKPVRLVQELHS